MTGFPPVSALVVLAAYAVIFGVLAVRDLARHYWRANQLWSASYFAGSAGGAPISVLRHYIEQQDRPA
jgi:REP element-mobilizing transposase RayT